MTGKLEGKTVLITGGGRGLGRAFAIRMAEEGADIAIVDIAHDIPGRSLPLAAPDDMRRTADLVQATGRQCLSFQADVRSAEALRKAFDETVRTFGRLDVLIANAGIGAGFLSSWQIAEADWDTVIGVNLKGAWLSAGFAARHMVERGDGGRIVFVSSQAGLKGYAGIASYCAAKFGVIGLMKSMAIELAPHGINVNAICPGSVDTEGNRLVAAEMGVSFETMVGEFTSRQLISKVMGPEQIASAGVYLASSESDFVTGHALAVDGGATTK